MNRLLYLLIFLFVATSFSFSQQESIWERYPDYIKEKNAFKRLEWFYRQRSAPDDFIDIKKFNEEKAKLVESINLEGRGTQLEWEPIGPLGINAGWPPQWGRISGRTRALAVHPANPDIVYAGASAGGLWKTTDGGENWHFAGEEFTNNSFGAIAIDPSNPDVIYAGTGESLLGYNPTTYTGDGIYKSTDAGDTWVKIGSPGDKTHVTDLLVHPDDSNLIFATLAAGYWHYGSPGTEGVWKSTNGGITWSTAIPGIANPSYDLEIHPTNSDILFAGVGGTNSNNGIYKSTNRGENWTRTGSGVSTSILNRMHIDIAESSPETMYMIVYSSGSGTSSAYKSTNGGQSFTQLSASHNFGGNYGSGPRDQGWYDLMIAVSPGDANLVFTGNLELHKTTDGTNFDFVRMPGGGGAWDSPMHVDYHKIVFAPSNTDVIYVGCDGGVYKSTDAGETWFSVNNGFSTIQFYRLSSSPFDENLMIGGAQDNGNFLRSTSGESSWDFVSTGDGMESLWDYSNPQIAYASTQYGSIYKTTNAGASITTISPNYSDTPAWTVPIIMHPTDPQILYTASRYVWRTTNGGNSWTAITGQMTSDAINTMAQSPVNPDNMILAGSGSYTANPRIRVSSDGGFTWDIITGNIPGTRKYVSRVYFHPTEANTCFVVRSGFGGGKLFRSEDLGESWSDVSGNLPDIPHNDFMIDPRNTNVYLILNDFGVYMSIDKGETWTYESNGMPVVPAMDFSYYTDGNKRLVRVGTHGRSAFQAELNNIIVPVELTSFTASAIAGEVILEWETATEINNMGFEVERSFDNSRFTRIAFIDGFGTTSERKTYRYTDDASQPVIYYRLKQIDFDGKFEYSATISVENDVPERFTVEQNYPNPFNPSTRVQYAVPENGSVKIFITNPLGEVVETIHSGAIENGKHEFMWNASGLPSGIYFYTIEYQSEVSARSFVETKKMIYLK
ncbi:MAG: hypothetical protein SCALA702_14910 [Melioribacteraceae bacterium]|nr:MAG: hypothetical protein SCALA702_14910 [Melioribacteraceae bacterium]